MNKTRKITLLHKIAHGGESDATPGERKELKKYKVYNDDSYYATKNNLSAYVNAVDNGYCLSFQDWCENNCKADRRRKGSSTSDMAKDNVTNGIAVMVFGWLTWGMALYWIFDGGMSVGACAILGAIISTVLLRINRRWVGVTIFLLPIILAVIFGR